MRTLEPANPGTDVDFTDGTPNTFDSNGYNLIGDGNASEPPNNAFDQTGDQSGVSDPKLGALADNGGPTNTHALLAGSPAVDKGKSDLTTDQRCEVRPFDDPGIAPATGGDDSDIGSFEAQSVLNSAPEANNDDAYFTNEDSTLTVAAPGGILSNDTDPDGDMLTVSAPSAARPTDSSPSTLTAPSTTLRMPTSTEKTPSPTRPPTVRRSPTPRPSPSPSPRSTTAPRSRSPAARA